MTTAETAFNTHHHLRTSFVLLLAASAVVGAGRAATGGYDVAMKRVEQIYDSAFGMKNVELASSKNSNMTATIGTAVTGCMDTAQFGVNRVRKAGSNPDSYIVSVRQIGEIALNPAAVEECVFKETGATTDVVVRQK